MSCIEPKPEHLSDPYVLQLIETICKQDDRIEELEHAIQWLIDTAGDLPTVTDRPYYSHGTQEIDPVDGYCGRKSSKQGLQAGETDE